MFKMDHLSYFDRGPFSLSIKAGCITAISGKSGCGKSLMVRAIANMVDHTVAHIELDSCERSQMSIDVWRQKLGIVLAHAFWWHDDVGMHFSHDITDMLDALNLPHCILKTSCKNLSAGESQRLSIIRTLCAAPKMLILDEPTANLDSTSTLLVEDLILEYVKKHQIPVMWITHHHDQIARVSLVHYVLEKGGLHAVNH